MESSTLRDAVGKASVRVGRYDVVGVVGHGGMGDVYEAVDTEHGGRVALKTLRVRAVDPERLLLFKNEFRAVADLSHPNLVPLYELGCHDGLWFFTMELVDGVDLIQGIRRTLEDASRSGPRLISPQPTRAMRPSTRRPRSDLETLEAPTLPGVDTPVCDLEFFDESLSQILDGLEYLHQHDVIHQDLKPSNILVEPSRQVRVLDFGLAQRAGLSGRLQSDRGAAIGTPPYMAPELLVGAAATPETDLFALGVVIYQLLAGRLPVPGRWVDAPHVPRLETLVDGVPEALSGVCHRLLSHDPRDRPSIDGVRAALGLTRTAPASLAPRRAFVGRDREQGLLRTALDRVRVGGSVVALVEGGSGVGKSALVRWCLRDPSRRGEALVLHGRCYESESVPYKGFDGMLDALAVRLSTQTADELAAVLPPWFDELTRVFPVLSRGETSRAHEAAAVPALELRRRVLEALFQLFANLAAQGPLVLEIDDLQWADADSLALLFRLLAGAPPGLLLVLSLRPQETRERVEAARLLAAVRALPAERAVTLALSPLKASDARDLARQTLRSLSLPESLAGAVADESGGVPFFLEELAHATAQRGGDVIQLEQVLAERARALPDAARALVEVLAVANNPIPRAVACEAAGLHTDVPRVLGALHRGHFVQRAGVRAADRLGIYHDRMRESVLASLSAARAASIHLYLGRALGATASAGGGPWLFDAARHLSAAESLLSDPVERQWAARLHLLAGQTARQAASFALALRCFEAGVALLPRDAWESAYETCLGLHVGAAEAAYLNAATPIMEERVAQVKAHSRSLLDQVPVWEVQIDALAGRHEYFAALDAGLEVLGLLGQATPPDPDEATVGAAFVSALEELGRVGPEGLAAMPDANDATVLAKMRLQVRLCPVAFFARPSLLALMACNLVSTSVEKGLSTATPNALALFGLIMNSAGMYAASHAWGELAIALLDRWEDRSLEAATRHVVFNFVCPWNTPLRGVLASSRQVFDLAQTTGDFEYGAYSAHMYTYMAMAAGEPLDALRDDALWLGEQIRSLGELNGTHLHAPFEQLLRCLTGDKEAPWSLDGAGFSEAAALASADATGARGSVAVNRVAMGLARFYGGRPLEAWEHFEVGRAHLDATPSCWLVPLCLQFGALSGTAAWDDLDEDARARVRGGVAESLTALRDLSTQTSVNLEHRVSLVEGELCRIDGDLAGALRRFQLALAKSEEDRCLGDVALAHELMARSLRQLSRDEDARGHHAIAVATYEAWGAHARSRALRAGG